MTKPGVKDFVADAYQLHLAGQFAEAETKYRKALRETPNHAHAHYLLGTLLLQRGEPAQAARSINRAIQLSSGSVEMFVNLSVAYQNLEQHDDAVAAARRALALDPNKSEVQSNLGLALTGQKDHEGALAAHKEYLRLKPTEARAHIAVGNAYLALDQFDAAMNAWENALMFDPYFIQAHIGIAEVLSVRGWFFGSRAVLENAIAIAPGDPNVQKRLGLLLVQLGELSRGWALQDKGRFLSETQRVIRRPEPPHYWTGGDLTGKRILVWTEQGPGDEILHASMIPDLLARGAICTVECSKRLVPVFARSFEGVKVLGYKQSKIPVTKASDFDYQISVASLGCFFRGDFTAFPRHRGYLRADPDKTALFRKAYEQRANGQRIVGISWRSAAAQSAKSASLLNLAPILQTPGVFFVNLQYGDCRDDLAMAREKLGVDIFNDTSVDSLKDLDTFFAQVAAMDLVISSSNTTVHVAGSQNIPVWMLLHHGRAAPYYWFLGREDSPWYPSARIFRALTADMGAWEIEPAQRIAATLAAWVGDTSAQKR